MAVVLFSTGRASAALGVSMLVLACASAPSGLPAAPEGSGALVVRAAGLTSASGQVAFALFGSEEAFEGEGEPLAVTRLAPAGDGSEWVISELPFGDYAVKVFHDLDDDGELDRGALGAPAEPYGFSNNARRSFGPPAFFLARFRHESERTVVEITVR